MPNQSTDKVRRFPRWPLVVLLMVMTLILLFKLFEPVFVYSSGWVDLPDETAPPFTSHFTDQAWKPAAVAAEEQLKASYEKIEVPGVSIAISKDGIPVWKASIGYADLVSKVALNSEHQFRLGSSSKAVTSVAVGRLLDKQLLELDAPIGDWEPSLPGNIQRITLRQVMSHRAGIRNYGMCFCFPAWEHLNRRSFKNVRESVDLIANDSFIHEPGGDFQYTSLGYNIAGLAIEKATKLSFEEALKTEVFAPMGMASTGLEHFGQQLPNSANGYDIRDGKFKPAFEVDNSIRWPSGGMVSTPSDMAVFGSAMLDSRLLSDRTRKTLLTIPESGRSNGGEFYALGWRVGKWTLEDSTEVDIVYHNGVAVGSVSIFMIFPEYGLVVSAMSNKVTESADELTALVKKIITPFVNYDRETT